MKPIITLTTDWNKNDFYAGAFKGRMLDIHTEARIVDITHQIRPFNIPEAAFILRNTYLHFPRGTIHLIGIKSVPGKKQHHILVIRDGHYFIGADNGIFGLMFPEAPDRVIRLSMQNALPTFPSLGLYTLAIKHLIQGAPVEELGEEQTSYY